MPSHPRCAHVRLGTVCVLALLLFAGIVASQQHVDAGNFRYATLDQTDASETAFGSQTTALALPSGWSIAPNEEEPRSVARAHVWGTDCLVLADGTSVPTSLGAGSDCSSSMIVVQGNGGPVLASVQPSTVSVSAAGSLVTITGSNLAEDVSRISLAGVVCEIVSVNATTVVVRIPHTGVSPVANGSVEVVSASRGTVVLPHAFNVVLNPTVSTVLPPNAPVTGGATVTVQGANLGATVRHVRFGTLEATVVSSSDTQVVVRLPSLPAGTPAPGAVDVTLETEVAGALTLPAGFRMLPPPRITAVEPARGPLAGQTLVTVRGEALGGGTDISRVALGDVPAAIVSQTADEVVVRSGAAAAAGAVDVRTHSDTQGDAVMLGGYTYLAPGVIASVRPNGSSVAGGVTVTIAGTDLGSGSDITAVTLAGVPATILSQSAEEVVVRAASTSVVATGDVRVESTSRGVAALANAFVYRVGGVVTSVSPPGGPLAGGNAVTITGSQFGTAGDVSSVTFGDISGTITAQNETRIVVLAPPGLAAGPVTLTIMSPTAGITTVTDGYRYATAGRLTGVDPIAGPVAGGQLLMLLGEGLSLGNDVSNVTLAGAAVLAILSQNDTAVVVRTAARAAGTGDVVLVNARGTVTLPGAYSYLTAGTITSIAPQAAPVFNPSAITVTIAGTDLGSGSDITAVTLAGVPATILSQTRDTVLVRPGPSNSTGSGPVVVQSVWRGQATSAATFAYLGSGRIISVQPSSSTVRGNTNVTIVGENLGAGNDITAVLLRNVSALILSQSATAVLVVSGPTSNVGTGSVMVRSASFGDAVLPDAFQYTAGAIRSVQPPQGFAGDTVTVSGENLGNGSDIGAVLFDGVAATIVSQTDSQVVVRVPAGSGTVGVEVRSATSGTLRLSGAFVYLQATAASTCPRGTYRYLRLASDLRGQMADFTDTTMQNPWGMAIPPRGHIADTMFPRGAVWIVSQVTFAAQAYDGTGQTHTVNGNPFVVNFSPGGGSPLLSYEFSYPGQAMPVCITINTGNEFRVPLADGSTAPAAWIVGSLDRAIHAWHPNLATPAPARQARLMLNLSNSAFTGLAMSDVPNTGVYRTSTVLYAADLKAGRVVVVDGNWNVVSLPGSAFADPALDANWSPYNIYALNRIIYVSFVFRDAFSGDRPRGAGGFVNAYDVYGNLLRRVASNGPLNAPFAMVLAPPSFGPLGGSLLVGNHGDGAIFAFDINGVDQRAGQRVVQAAGDPQGEAINLKNCWFGNGAATTPENMLFCVRGVGERETHGLYMRWDALNC